MKRFLLLPLCFIPLTANAVPNIWRMGVAQGYVEYSIQDAKGQTLWISCNEAAGDEADHSAWFETKSNHYQNSSSKYPLTFLLDGKTEVAPPESTKWRNGANAWYEFTTGIATAKKIEVYLNNKKITTFLPTKQSLTTVAKYIAECSAMF